MKKRSVYGLCFLFVLLSGVGMFLLKYHVRDREKALAALYHQIRLAERELHTLSAEWAHHTDPSRLREMAKQLNLSSVPGTQIIQTQQIQNRPAPRPDKKPNFHEVEE